MSERRRSGNAYHVIQPDVRHNVNSRYSDRSVSGASLDHDQYGQEARAGTLTFPAPSDKPLPEVPQPAPTHGEAAIQSGQEASPSESHATPTPAPQSGLHDLKTLDIALSASGELLPANVIIFGESGVGKSSLINMLSDDESAPAAVSNQALGCTFETQPYHVTIDEREYVLWDTAGLNEGSKGSVSADEACEKLVDLLKQLKGGVHLLVYVLRGSRFRSIVRINYEIFQRVVFRGQVPIVLVATGLENEDRMENWWDENREDLAANGLQFDGHACVTATKGKMTKSGEYIGTEGGGLEEHQQGLHLQSDWR